MLLTEAERRDVDFILMLRRMKKIAVGNKKIIFTKEFMEDADFPVQILNKFFNEVKRDNYSMQYKCGNLS